MSNHSDDAAGLKALGSGHTDYGFDGPHKALLETFPSVMDQTMPVTGYNVEMRVPEFTSVCPMTGQPDFATILVNYVPDGLCVESKSFKLYMMSFRNAGMFHERCVVTIGQDLCELLKPHSLQVQGQFTPRGGISFWPTFFYSRPAQTQQ